MSTRIAVHGVAGRMGRLLLARVLDASDMALSAAWERNGHPALGRDAATLLSREPAGVVVSDDLAAWVDVILDFSLPEGSSRLMKNLIAQDRPAALVCGTTGLSPAEHELLDALSAKTAVLHAPNFSLGVNLLAHLVGQAAKALPAGYDVEIVEAHHRNKQDAPSGTAMLLGHAAAKARGATLPDDGVFARHGVTGVRKSESIGFCAVRGGGVVGDHDVHFLGDMETVTLSHRALTRDVLADGAIRATRFLAGKPAGRYSMMDVLGLR